MQKQHRTVEESGKEKKQDRQGELGRGSLVLQEEAEGGRLALRVASFESELCRQR